MTKVFLDIKNVFQSKDFTDDHFHTIIDDAKPDNSIISKLILCSGKIYYDLIEELETKRKKRHCNY